MGPFADTADDIAEESPRLTLGVRLANAGRTLKSWLRVLLFPFAEMPARVELARYAAPMVAVTLCALLSAIAITARLEVPASAPPMGDQAQKPEEQQGEQSDRELAESAAKAKAVETVKLFAGAAATPISMLAIALGLYLVGRFVGGKPSVRKTMTLSAHSFLPLGIYSAITAGSALRYDSLTPAELPHLVWPAIGHPLGAKLLELADPFSIWMMILIAAGFASAAGVGRRKAIVSVAISCALILILKLPGAFAPQGPT